MRRSLSVVLLAASACLVAPLPAASAAVTDPAELPLVVSPASGARLAGDFAGPVVIDFSPVRVAEDYYVSARLQGDCDPASTEHRCAAEATVSVAEGTGQVAVTLSQPLERDGDYRLRVGALSGGLVTTSEFSLTGTSGGAPATPSATVTAPAGHVPAGTDGPVVVDFGTTDYPHGYLVRLEDDARNEIWSTSVTTTGGTYDWIVPRLQQPGRYRVVVADADGSPVLDQQVFAVDPRPLRLSAVEASYARFFPRVRDGYRDTVAVGYRQSDVAAVQWTVRDASGHRVRTKAGRVKGAGEHRVRWNGRDGAGHRVPVGRYTITLRGMTEDGRTDRARVEVRVATKKVWHSATKELNGQQWTDRSKRGSCYFLGYAGRLNVDCWGGRYAEARYGFRVPATATHVTWGMRGTVNCCDDGRITRSGVRVSDRRVVVKVRVTGWRSYTVRRASIAYDWFTRL